MPHRIKEFLIVEDNTAERDIIAKTLRAILPNVRITALSNCADALDYVFARGEWSDRAGCLPPSLILLDLSIAGLSGFSVLEEIRAGEPGDALTLAPVVMFTDSQAPQHITEGFRSGANSFIVKPVGYPDFRAVVELIGRYWSMQHRSTLQIIPN